ncbi:MAG: hydroxymethylbilane synthase, partial [Chitinophagaceae bacterium]
MGKLIRIGTRESQLAVWQATRVQTLLQEHNINATLVLIKSDGDIDLQTPLYEMGVQGIFTRSLDVALLNNKIDIAVHSMKDVPTQLPAGIAQAAVLQRASHKDLFVYKPSALSHYDWQLLNADATSFESKFDLRDAAFTIATSSTRRRAQWLNRFPNHDIQNLRGNINTRLKKVEESNWHGALFAAAGVERIAVRPEHSIDIQWMLPAPAQGAIMVVARQADEDCLQACAVLNHVATATCTKVERDFLRGYGYQGSASRQGWSRYACHGCLNDWMGEKIAQLHE